jgi:hypothetical protein
MPAPAQAPVAVPPLPTAGPAPSDNPLGFLDDPGSVRPRHSRYTGPHGYDSSDPYQSPRSPLGQRRTVQKVEGFTIVEYLVAFFVSFPLSWILFWLISIPVAHALKDEEKTSQIVIGLLFLAALVFPFAVVILMRTVGRRRF